MEVPSVLTIPAQHAANPRNDTNWGKPFRTRWKEMTISARNIKPMNMMEV